MLKGFSSSERWAILMYQDCAATAVATLNTRVVCAFANSTSHTKKC